MKEELGSTELENSEGENNGVELKGREIDTQVSEDAKWITKLFGGLIKKIDKEQKIEEITGFSDELE